MNGFSKVVMWGHKLHTNTFSYVHYGIERAFRHLGYETAWLDDSDDVSGASFSNCLFFTEGQVDGKIPLDPSSKYVLHNCSSDKYPNRLNLQVCRETCPEHNSLQYAPETESRRGWARYHRPSNTLFQPWATDLLPHEIDVGWAGMPRKNACHWVGTIGSSRTLYGNEDEIAPFSRACKENGVEFIHHWPNKTPSSLAIGLIQESIVAPAIHGAWQLNNGYYADRLFKNISYGHLGVTNSEVAQRAFGGRLIYNKDGYQLFYDALPHLGDKARIVDLMETVRDEHTYVSRAEMILSVL